MAENIQATQEVTPEKCVAEGPGLNNSVAGLSNSLTNSLSPD